MSNKSSKCKVMFVCLGNICRSPMAEAVFANIVEKKGLSNSFHIESCGTAGYHIGETPHPKSVSTCKKHGVPVNHRAQQISKNHFKEFDYILCMDYSNLSDLKSIQSSVKDLKSKLFLFGQFDTEIGDKLPLSEKAAGIIEDPYYGGIEGYEYNFSQCSRCGEGFLKYLEAQS